MTRYDLGAVLDSTARLLRGLYYISGSAEDGILYLLDGQIRILLSQCTTRVRERWGARSNEHVATRALWDGMAARRVEGEALITGAELLELLAQAVRSEDAEAARAVERGCMA